MKFPAAALNQHIAILGKTGSGKSYCAKVLTEGLLDQGRQVCVLDPTGAWWGLRLGADGKSRGYDVVLLGGKHADIPLAERSGPAVARLVTQQGASIVVDTSGFSVGEYTRWFTEFAGTLYTTIRNPLHLVIDEAHYFAPQGKAPDPAAGKMIHACNRLMSGGRSLGIRGMLITQRPAKLHKDSLTCADTLIAMRVIAPQDRGAIKDWIDGAGDAVQGKAVLDSLAGLSRGEGWVWYPEGGFLERMKFPAIKTYDSSATPVHGAKAGPKVTEIKLDEVKAALADAVKEAEANDPGLLRKQIAELKAQLAKQPKAVTDQATIDRAIAQARRENAAALAERDRIIRDLSGRMGKCESLASQLATTLHVNGEAKPRPVTVQASQPVQPKKLTNQVNENPSPRPKTDYQSGKRESGDLPKGEAAVLSALIQYPDGLRNEQLTVLTGYKRSSRDTYLQRLRERGYAERRGELHAATADGREALPEAEPLPTGQALQQFWLSRLPEGERAILTQAIESYPEAVEKAELDERTGYKRSSRDSYLQRLKAKQLVEVSRDGVTASETLF